jgi:hypothetical protein
MNDSRRLSAKEKALKINLDTQLYGSFAEIGAGQETAAHFFKAGGASGTVAKTMSAYDMSFSDAIYGETSRYVCEERLVRMLEKEYGLLGKRLSFREEKTCFFAFSNTVETTNFHKTNQAHGWLGVRFQRSPKSEPIECVIHIVMHDTEASWQQRAIGIIGVNLLYACFYFFDKPETLISSLLDSIVPGTVEIDLIRFKGEGISDDQNLLYALKLVKNGLTKAAMFGPDGSVLQPSEALYKKNALVVSGRFRPFTRVHEDMLLKATDDFREELGDKAENLLSIAELSLNALIDLNGNINDEDFLDRARVLMALGHTVMITNFLDYWYLVPYLSKATRNQKIGFVLSVRNIERLFDSSEFTSLRGGLLEGFSMLFGTNAKAYAYPALRRDTGNTITLETIDIPAQYRGLFQYLKDNDKVEDIRNARLELLHINMDELQQQIQLGEKDWEQWVPERVSELIKSNCLFGYPCLPEVRDNLTKNFNHGI